MKKNIIYMAALTIMAAACSSEDETMVTSPEQSGKGEVKMITETIRATNGDGTTRAAIDENAAFSWSDGDQIAVHLSNGQYYTTDGLGEGKGGNIDAEFDVTYPEGNSRDAFAVYPATIANASNYGQDGATLDVTLPSSYKLDKVSDNTTPCPMIATNEPGNGWEFKQLCGLLRLTVSNIPEGASFLQVDFSGKQVCGDFSIASPKSNEPTISTSDITSASASNAGDKIKITDLGSATSAVINIPLPTGQYSGIKVSALTSSNVTMGELVFNYTAKRAKGKKVSYDMPSTSTALMPGTVITTSGSSATDLESIVGLEFKYGETILENLRFVRIYSEGNMLQATYEEGANKSTLGPITAARGNDETAHLPQPLFLGLRFNETAASPIVVQVIDADGKVYSGSTTAPISFKNGYIYKITVPVNLYTFTVETNGKKVYFSPGDLGVNSGVYSFTEPFTTWAHGNTTYYSSAASQPAQRVWFDQYLEGFDQATVYDVNGTKDWRIPKRSTTRFPNSPVAYEWNNIIHRNNMNSGVNGYYKVTIPGHQYCLLLPPDETQSTDIGSDLTSGNVTDYVKYLGKGFVLLFNTNRGLTNSSSWSWGDSTSDISKQGYYWTVYNSSNRYYFTWPDSQTPAVDWGMSKLRIHIRLVHDVPVSNN